ncbi:MAG: hypothetical protein FJX75_04805, partial [Armatimonadetes bacterium]|nr:hypothetical protein [Armatimonadota bacterium]
MSDAGSAGRSSGWFPTFRRLLRWRIWRVWRIVAYGLLALLLLGGLLNLVGNLYYGHRVKAEIRALKAAGHPVTPADITPPPVSEAENAAPLYKAAAQIVKPHQEGASGTGPNATYPFGYRDREWNDPKVLACLAQLVKEDRAALDLVRQASAKPGYRSETDYSDPAIAEFPQFNEAAALAYFLASAAV